jgi:hypothetical protein
VFEELARRSAAERVAALVHGLASTSNCASVPFSAPYSVDSAVWNGYGTTMPPAAYSPPVLPIAPPDPSLAGSTKPLHPTSVSSGSAPPIVPSVFSPADTTVTASKGVQHKPAPSQHRPSARSARSDGSWKSVTSRESPSGTEEDEPPSESSAESEDESYTQPRRDSTSHSLPSHRSEESGGETKRRRRVKKSTVAPPASAGFVVVTANPKRRNWGNPANKRWEAIYTNAV